MVWIYRINGQIDGFSRSAPPVNEATVEQLPGWEEIAEDAPEYIAWLNRTLPVPLNWSGLLNHLRGTAIFGKTLTGNPNYFSVLNSALTSTNNLQDFEWALTQIRPTMAADFTGAEIAQINTWLEECGFDLRLS